MNRPLVLLFGGQSSRDPAMFERLSAADPVIGARAWDRAARHVTGDLTDSSSNRTLQVSVFAVMLGWLELLSEAGVRSSASAGLSLGEYAHIVDIGALDADDALALVAQRGELYDHGPSGAMAAIFPSTWDELRPVVDRIAEVHGGPAALAPAVFNSPTQNVIGGIQAAVAELVDAVDEELYATGVVVEHRIPMHTPRFRPVARPFRAVLEGVRWNRNARLPYRPNVNATATRADPGTLIDCLTRHVYEPVLWRDMVDALVREYPDAVFLEPGPRTVVRDLMLRRWHADRQVLALDEPVAACADARERVEATLRAVAGVGDPLPSELAGELSTASEVPAVAGGDA